MKKRILPVLLLILLVLTSCTYPQNFMFAPHDSRLYRDFPKAADFPGITDNAAYAQALPYYGLNDADEIGAQDGVDQYFNAYIQYTAGTDDQEEHLYGGQDICIIGDYARLQAWDNGAGDEKVCIRLPIVYSFSPEPVSDPTYENLPGGVSSDEYKQMSDQERQEYTTDLTQEEQKQLSASLLKGNYGVSGYGLTLNGQDIELTDENFLASTYVQKTSITVNLRVNFYPESAGNTEEYDLRLYLKEDDETVREDTLCITYAPSLTPVFTVAPGVADGKRGVTIESALSGAKIYYTLDGTEPDEQSDLYEGPLNLPVGTTVTARVADPHEQLHDSDSIVIGKAAPEFTLPTGLTATVGQTLGDVALPADPNGVFSWEPAAATSVGAVGENAFTVTYTPNDSDNYTAVAGITVMIKVTGNPETAADGIAVPMIFITAGLAGIMTAVLGRKKSQTTA